MYLSLFLLPLIAHYTRINVQSQTKLLKFEQKIAKPVLFPLVCSCLLIKKAPKWCTNRGPALLHAMREP